MSLNFEREGEEIVISVKEQKNNFYDMHMSTLRGFDGQIGYFIAFDKDDNTCLIRFGQDEGDAEYWFPENCVEEIHKEEPIQREDIELLCKQ